MSDIKTKPYTKEYARGHDRIFKRKVVFIDAITKKPFNMREFLGLKKRRRKK